MRLKLLFLSLTIGLGGVVACSITATRPVQEMSNAEIAVKAAKDLNADSLVPDTYRSAVDHYFKAKRDFRLKNFETSRVHALKATRLAEQAEFEAYRLGGATPEAAARGAPEGSTTDAESSLREGTPPPEDLVSPPSRPEKKKAPSGPPNEEEPEPVATPSPGATPGTEKKDNNPFSRLGTESQ